MDPHTGRVTELYANAAYCRLAGGATVAAHLARVAARALPEHVTHVDHLCRLNPTIDFPRFQKSDYLSPGMTPSPLPPSKDIYTRFESCPS